MGEMDACDKIMFETQKK